MNKFIIFGGAGFIGSHLVKELRNHGCKEIVVADIHETEGPKYPDVIYKFCDVREPIPADLVSGQATVVNLAAVHRTPGHPDHEYFDTNVKGARNIVKFCEETNSVTLWFTSSIAVYGPSEEPKSEESILRPESAYGKSKMEAESLHLKWAESDARRKLVIVRPAVVFGARENGNFTKLAKAMKRGFFVYPGRRDTIKGCGYVEDLLGSIFYMNAQPERSNLYNYCYPESYTINDICDAFAKVAGYRRPLGTIPLSPMINAARIFQYLNAIGLKNSIHPARILKLIHSTNIVPDELIKRAYPYRTDLEEGLRRWLADDPSGEFV